MPSKDKALAQLYANIPTIKRLIRSEVYRNLVQYNLSYAQFELISTIKQSGLTNARDLAKQLQLTAGAVSQLVEGLEDSGFISRQPDPIDRRVQSLSLTKKAGKCIEQIHANKHAILTKVFSELTDEELGLIVQINHKLAKALEKYNQN